METEEPEQDSNEELEATSPTAHSKRPLPPLKDATKSARKKNRSENVHLPASDVRSNYHRIFETIFNGCPKSTATKHFKSMCAEDCVMVIRSVNNPFGPNYRELRGIESMVEYVDTALEAIPDCIFAITDSKFFRKPQNESMVISSYTTSGRMIYTIDTLNSEDVEDIDSAISGLQMLYQGSCGSEAGAHDETVQLVCQQIESVASKMDAHHPNKNTNSKSADSLYSFVYAGNPLAEAAATLAPGPSPAAALALTTASAASSPRAGPPIRAVTVEPFDYRAKFSETGASLFEPAVPLGDDNDEVDDLINLEIKAATAAVAAAVATVPGDAIKTEGLRPSSSSATLLSTSSFTSPLLAPTPTLTGSSDSLTIGTTQHNSTNALNTVLSDLSIPGKDTFWMKSRSNVMIVKESAKFCLKEKIPMGRQMYKVKGTLTLHINSDKRVRRVEMLHSFDTSMHR